MKKLKIFKILLINILLLSLLLVSADYLIFCLNRNAFNKTNPPGFTAVYPFPDYIENYTSEFSANTIQYLRNIEELNFRGFNIDENSTKPPVIIFGCSFAFSYMLEDNQTLNYKLSKLTKRNYFNFGIPSFGIQHMLYIIQNNFYGAFDNSNDINIPEYAVFIYIPSHLQRLQADIFPAVQNIGQNLKYELHKDKLKLKKNLLPDFFYRTYILKSLYILFNKKEQSDLLKYKYKSFMLANEIFLESKRLLEEKFPNIKFIILNYQIEDDCDSDFEMPFMFEVLQKEGFIVINTEDLIGRKFKNNSEDTAEDGCHPSEAVWDILAPELIKKLNL